MEVHISEAMENKKNMILKHILGNGCDVGSLSGQGIEHDGTKN